MTSSDRTIVIECRQDPERKNDTGRLQVDVEAGLAKALRNYARISGKTQGEVVEDALRSFFDRGRSGPTP